MFQKVSEGLLKARLLCPTHLFISPLVTLPLIEMYIYCQLCSLVVIYFKDNHKHMHYV